MNEVNIDIDLLIVKLQREIESAVVFVTVKTALLQMAVRALQQQKAQIEADRPVAPLRSILIDVTASIDAPSYHAVRDDELEARS